MTIALQPKRIFRILIFISLSLVLCSLIFQVLVKYSNALIFEKLFKIFDVDSEHNLPAVYSFLELMAASIILTIIYLLENKKTTPYNKKPWLLMSGVFFYLAIDELEELHERLDSFMAKNFHTSGWLHFAWILPYTIGVIILAISLIPFLRKLPLLSSKQFIIAGFIYCTGALGGDCLGGSYLEKAGALRINYAWIGMYHMEETLEMCGIAFFIYALLRHIKENISSEIKVELI